MSTPDPTAPMLRVSLPEGMRDFAADQVVLGRDLASDVVVAHEDVSRRHVIFQRSGGEWFVVDQGSTNGTFAGGQRVSHLRVIPGLPLDLQVGGLRGALVRVEVIAPAGWSGSGPLPAPPAAAPPVQMPVQMPPPMGAEPPAGPGYSQPAPEQSAYPQPGPPQQASYGSGQELWGLTPAPQVPPGQLAHGYTLLPDSRPSGGQVLTIGRTRNNDVVLDDPLVSRQHATLELGQQVILRDLGSFNGTFVNGQRVSGSVRLAPGNEVIFGNQTFTWDGQQMISRATRNDLTLFVEDVTTTVKGGKRLLEGVNFQLDPSSLTAVIGPSGAGKSTLLGAITGLRPATHGNVIWQGHDLYTHYDQLRYQIGLVPQQDIQHPQLTVRQGLSYAARLRLPPDTTHQERHQRVEQVVSLMQLQRQIDNRIGTQLSGGQKKRVSIATELLTAPPLLFLDEPTSGLDPGLDRDVMHQLRRLADEGRVVMVVTHSVLALDVCDNVVVMAPGGRVAYFGPPSGVLDHFGCQDYPQVFDMLDDPDLWQRIPPPPGGRVDTGRLPSLNQPVAPPPQQSLGRQLGTLIARNLAVTVSDRLLLAMLVLMPIVLGLLSRVVPGDDGLSIQDTMSTRPGDNGEILEIFSRGEAVQRLTILIVAAALMGTAVTIRELVKERPIFQREYAVGLSPGMYLISKVLVLGTASFFQGLLVTFISLVGLPGPDDGGATGLGSFEIALAIGALAFSMAVIGLAVSALVTSSEQTMPALVGLVMVQLVLSGALVAMAGRAGLEQVAWLAPARWGYAACAASVDLDKALTNVKDADLDSLWDPTAAQYIGNLGVLGVLTVIALGLGFVFVRRSARAG